MLLFLELREIWLTDPTIIRLYHMRNIVNKVFHRKKWLHKKQKIDYILWVFYNIYMDNNIDEKSKKIEDIYNETINKIKEFENRQKEIASKYIKKLEEEKIKELEKLLKD